MAELEGQGLLHIKKYPNRRYYDTTRSCHVTLKDVHALVVGGHDVCITDSRTGDDITNLVLMQIVIEKDQPKLDLFPASVMHMMVRANRQALRGYVDQFFTPFLGIMARSRNQFDTYMRRMMSGQFVSPAEWGSYLAQVFGGGTGARAKPEGDSEDTGDIEDPFVDDPPDVAGSATESPEDLRDQLAELTRRIEELTDRGIPKVD